MICRWCGEKVDPKERRCPACGHEMPPLSDCGGYIGITAPTTQGISEQPRIQNAKSTGGSSEGRHNRKTFFCGGVILYMVLVLFLSAVTVLLISEKVDMNKLSNTVTTEMNEATTVQDQIISDISELQQSQKAMEEKLVSMISSNQSVSSAPPIPEPTPVSLETQDIKLELWGDGQGKLLLSSVDLDEYSAPVSVSQKDGAFQCVIGGDETTPLWTVKSSPDENEYSLS